MSGYGTCKWTCGECGESYEHSGVVGDLKVGTWTRDHREMHRVQRMTPEEQDRHYAGMFAAMRAVDDLTTEEH